MLERRISKSEILKALEKLEIENSSGLDGIPSKLLVWIVPSTLDAFLAAFNEFYKNGLQLD